MAERTPADFDSKTVGLMYEAIDQTKGLAETQAEIVKREVQRALSDLLPGLVWVGAGVALAVMGIASVLSGARQAIFRRHPMRVGIMLGMGFSIGAVAIGRKGLELLPTDLTSPLTTHLKRDLTAALQERS